MERLAVTNYNTGAWTIHIVLIACLKIFYDVIPGVSQETSWTLTNMTYMFGSYIMFHHVRGVPFDFNSGAFDNLNMWEQIDNGAQYTPTKKFLLSVPIVLFLLSTHYTHYDLAYFVINFLAVLGVIIPKLPFVRPQNRSLVLFVEIALPRVGLGSELHMLLVFNPNPKNMPLLTFSIATESQNAFRSLFWNPRRIGGRRVMKGQCDV